MRMSKLTEFSYLRELTIQEYPKTFDLLIENINRCIKIILVRKAFINVVIDLNKVCHLFYPKHLTADEYAHVDA